MTAKFDKFVDALEELCRAHGVQIITSAYDLIEVWDLGRTTDEPIYGLREQLTDKTVEP